MRQFLKYTLASFTGSLLLFIVLTFLLGIGAIGLVGVLVASVARGTAAPDVEQDSMLVYNLSTIITDSEEIPDPGVVFFEGPQPSQLTLREVLVAIDAAAQDDRIAGLYLQGGFDVGAGLAAQMEIYKAIGRFRESGKPVVAYDVSWTEQEYFLASQADTVYLNPFGEVEMNGLYAEMMYQAEALEKLGIGVQVTRVGKYKSAVEPLIRDSMSPEEREQTQRLLQDLWQTMLADTAQPRSLQPQQLQTIANQQGFLFGEEAKTQNLVDEIAYEDEVLVALRGITGEQPPTEQADEDIASPEEADAFRQVSLSRYTDVADDDLQTRRASNQIALLYAEGPIVDGEAGGGFGQPQVIAGNTVARQLRQLRYDDDVKAVVFRINSPGGSATASEVILREVRLLQEAGKPVVVSMGNVAASGGYWIASLADSIVAEPTTITGSIGVFSLFLNLEDLGQKVGVNWDGVKTSELADIFTATRPKTSKELAILQKAVDQVYNEFLARVVEGRDMPLEKVAEIAQGRVWSGKSAQQLGLVDELGGLDRAIAIAAELADLEDDWRLQEYPETEEWQRFFEDLFTQKASRTTSQDLLTTQVNRFMDDLSLVQTLNDPRGIYMLMPFTIRVE
jgi:protease-4